jgi:hypothetical protein
MATLIRLIVYLWVSPVTLLGLLFSAVSRVTGGGGHFHSGVWEAWGGWPASLLESGLPFAGSVAAIAIGHVVLGVSEQVIHDTRAHERAHVRQYELWGPLFYWHTRWRAHGLGAAAVTPIVTILSNARPAKLKLNVSNRRSGG